MDDLAPSPEAPAILGETGDVTRVFDAQFDGVYEIEPRESRVTVVTTPGNVRVRASLLRVVREFAMNHSHGRGLFLHASAVATEGGALVIAGPKAAGKTTLLTYLLSDRAGHYLSNDRVLVTEPSRRMLLRNMPTVVRVPLTCCSGSKVPITFAGICTAKFVSDEQVPSLSTTNWLNFSQLSALLAASGSQILPVTETTLASY